jgi:hypothetical protein
VWTSTTGEEKSATCRTYQAGFPNGHSQMIKALRKDPSLDETGRTVLERLATDDRMIPDIWNKLPVDPNSGAGDVIEHAVIAVMAFGLETDAKNREALSLGPLVQGKAPAGSK